MVWAWFRVGSGLVHGRFADGSRVVLASLACSCARACVCCKSQRKSRFALGLSLVQVGSGLVHWWFAVGSRAVLASLLCRFASACPCCESRRKSWFANYLGLVQGWLKVGSLVVRGWFLRICAAVLRARAFDTAHEENRGSLVVPSWFMRCSRVVHAVVQAGFIVGSLVRCWFLCSGPLFSLSFSDCLAEGCNIGFQLLRPGRVLLRY